MDVKKWIDLDKYSALLFDCDGTIADSMPLHLVAWNKALAKWGVRLTEEEHERWAGRPTAVIVDLLNKERGVLMDAAAVSAGKEAAYFELLPSVQPVRAVGEVLRALHGQLPFAVVSGSPRDSVEKTLRHLGLMDLFEVILGSGDYPHGKPAPDCFFAAAAQLSVSPSRCLVFEDADLGIEAARAAGMAFIRVSSAGFLRERSEF